MITPPLPPFIHGLGNLFWGLKGFFEVTKGLLNYGTQPPKSVCPKNLTDFVLGACTNHVEK